MHPPAKDHLLNASIYRVSFFDTRPPVYGRSGCIDIPLLTKNYNLYHKKFIIKDGKFLFNASLPIETVPSDTVYVGELEHGYNFGHVVAQIVPTVRHISQHFPSKEVLIPYKYQNWYLDILNYFDVDVDLIKFLDILPGKHYKCNK